ncbi:hypothetical protein PLICRDRAFT_101630 [Plicaturopsis crispa FD-325 SS-3]|nr:hypothetical protein PLICRDRAFT_101630 [Plicaturopsis crispa FD-325 SS-3]
MSSAQIKTLLAPPDLEQSRLHALRLLDAQFPSLERLSDLDEAARQAQEEAERLNTQLLRSQSDITTLLESTRAEAASHIHSAQELALLRHSLSDEVAFLSRELVSAFSDADEERRPTLLEDIETMHRNLKELESVRGYVQVVEHSLSLSESALQQIRDASSPISQSSLSSYQSLQEFTSSVSTACSRAEDGAGQQSLHLVRFLSRMRDKAWFDIKGVLSARLLGAAERLKWPMPVDYASASPHDREEFEAAFRDLLRLQTIGRTICPQPDSDKPQKEGLYPIQALVQPVSLRFKYHFEGTRQTNRLDKPEWYFTHVINVAHEHRGFMDSIVHQLLSTTEYRTINAWREFTFLLLPLLARKLRRTVPTLLPHPALLAHTIYQALAFDAALVEAGFELDGSSAPEAGKWEGVSEIILGRREWFDAWLEGEKNFTEDQYGQIISAPDAWLISDDEHDDHELRSTNSARRVKALVAQVTDRYAPLPHPAHRTRFLVSVQLPLLEAYLGRISSSLDAFETLSSAFVRAVPGALGLGVTGGSRVTMAETGAKIDTSRLTSGVEGTQRLCKALLGAKYLCAAMDAWGEELFFLELWSDINRTPSLRQRAEANPLLPRPRKGDADEPEGTIFEVLVEQYTSLIERAEEMIIQQICGEIENGLRAHFAAHNTYLQDDLALSQTLLAPLALLSSNLSFLRRTLPSAAAIALYRRIAARLAEHILQRAIMYKGRLAAEDGQSVHAEAELWVETCQGALGAGESRARVEAPWAVLLEAARLVGAQGQTWEKVVEATFGMRGDDEWEEVLADTVGVHEMSREEVGRVLRIREDCYR